MNWRLLVSAVTLVSAVPALAADKMSADTRMLAQLQQAVKSFQERDSKSCMKNMRAVIGASGFSRLNDDVRSHSYHLASVCSLGAGNQANAREFAVQATQIGSASAEAWRLRGELEMDNQAQPAAAVIGLEAMAARAPEALNTMPQDVIFAFYRRIKKGSDPALQRRVLEVLAAKTYTPAEVGGSADHFRSELARLRAAEGDHAGASALISAITRPYTLLTLSLDPRTRALVPAEFDARAATERELTHRRDVAASHPSSLNAVIEVADALRWLGRYEEALAGLMAASPEGAEGTGFADRDEKLNWWWDAVGYANAYLGRYEAALAAFRKGMESSEYGGANVSQTINLANQQLIFGRNEDAIRTLAPLGEGKNASPYGVMQLIGVRGCARFRSGDKRGADADYAYAKAHDQDAPDTLTDLALCRNDLDEAAASLVRRLDHTDQRTDALMRVSDFDPLPDAYPKRVEDERLTLVKARPDVKAAIARAGGARRFNLMSPPF